MDFPDSMVSYHLLITCCYLTPCYSHQNITSGVKQFSSIAAAHLNLKTDAFFPENSFWNMHVLIIFLYHHISLSFSLIAFWNWYFAKTF